MLALLDHVQSEVHHRDDENGCEGQCHHCSQAQRSKPVVNVPHLRARPSSSVCMPTDHRNGTQGLAGHRLLLTDEPRNHHLRQYKSCCLSLPQQPAQQGLSTRLPNLMHQQSHRPHHEPLCVSTGRNASRTAHLLLCNGLSPPHVDHEGVGAHEHSQGQQDHGDQLHQVVSCLQLRSAYHVLKMLHVLIPGK